MSVKSFKTSGVGVDLAPKGLVLINTTSFSGVSSFSLAQDTFTSTYDNYKMICQLTGATADAEIRMRLRIAGTDTSAANYYNVIIGREVDNDAFNFNENGQSYFKITETDSGNNNSSYHFSMEIIGPKPATRSLINFAASGIAASGGVQGSSGAGLYFQDTSFDSLSILSSAGNISGKYSVFGYAK
jgi:hypothetical protein